MNATAAFDWSTRSDLERVVEPLASYICASDKPKTELFSALAVLCRQVDSTNGLAVSQVLNFLHCH